MDTIHQYIAGQLDSGFNQIQDKLYDTSGYEYLPRNIYIRIKKHLDSFINKESEIRIIGIPGLRGVGKTTLLAQIYRELNKNHQGRILYLSTDIIVKLIRSDLYTALQILQETIGKNFWDIKNPFFLLIDEVHYDAKWPSVLKWIFDSSKNVFVIFTGSSALSLQSTTDLARRVIYEKLYPLNFSEYILLKTHRESKVASGSSPIYPKKGLKKKLKEAVFLSNSVKECFESIKSCEREVKDYWLSINRLEVDNYLKFGTMPFTIATNDEALSASLIKEVIDKVINQDLPLLNKFSPDTISKAISILYMVAASDETSISSLAKNIDNISQNTLSDLLDAFEKAEMLIRAHPYGPAFKKVRKPSKYHFMSPSLRLSLLRMIESGILFPKYVGKFLEDIVALTIYRNFEQTKLTHINYDSAKNGADFIVILGVKNLVLEVGYGEKGIKQVINSMKKHPSLYGIVVSRDPLELIESENIIKIPLETFLLL